MARRLLSAALLAPVLSAAGSVAAQSSSSPLFGGDPSKTYFYVGAGPAVVFDNTNYREPENSGSKPASATYGLTGYLGVRAHYVGLELWLTGIGKLGFNGTDTTGYRSEESTYTASALALVGYIPLGDKWDIVPRVGLNLGSGYRNGKTCRSNSRYSRGRTYECRESLYTAGIGVRYAISEKWAARFDYTYVPIQDSRQEPRKQLHQVGLNFEYRF